MVIHWPLVSSAVFAGGVDCTPPGMGREVRECGCALHRCGGAGAWKRMQLRMDPGRLCRNHCRKRRPRGPRPNALKGRRTGPSRSYPRTKLSAPGDSEAGLVSAAAPTLAGGSRSVAGGYRTAASEQRPLARLFLTPWVREKMGSGQVPCVCVGFLQGLASSHIPDVQCGELVSTLSQSGDVGECTLGGGPVPGQLPPCAAGWGSGHPPSLVEKAGEKPTYLAFSHPFCVCTAHSDFTVYYEKCLGLN